jgi:hypothetical protein
MDPEVKFAPPRPSFSNFDPVVQHIRALDYWNCRLFLSKRIGPEKYPHFQYKYKALASAATERRAAQLRDILVESRFWLSSPRDFNDPFDMTARVIFEGETEDLRQRFKQLIADKSGKRWKERREMLDQFMGRPRSEWQKAGELAHSKNHEQTGVFSFAGDPRSVVMWGHYGDHHTGVCLQFEVAKDPKTMLEAVPVQYVKDYPVFNWAEDSGKQIGKSLMHKFEAWAYEGEWRIVWPNGARSYLPFNPAALVGLIFGCRTSEAAIRIVDAMLEERKALRLPSICVYRAEKHESRYALMIRRVS